MLESRIRLLDSSTPTWPCYFQCWYHLWVLKLVLLYSTFPGQWLMFRLWEVGLNTSNTTSSNFFYRCQCWHSVSSYQPSTNWKLLCSWLSLASSLSYWSVSAECLHLRLGSPLTIDILELYLKKSRVICVYSNSFCECIILYRQVQQLGELEV
jgi:hypothetical protein